jgi:integrase
MSYEEGTMALIKRCKVCRKQGSLVKDCDHKEAVWAVHYRVNGRQVLKTVGPNKRDAERYLIKVKSEINTSGSFEVIKPILFNELAEKWYEQKKTDERRPGTLWAYRVRLDHHILPFFGKKAVSQVTRGDVEEAKLKTREKLSARSTNFVLTQVKAIFRHGMRLGFCKLNPAEFIEPCKGAERFEGSFLTTEECPTLLKHCEEPFRTIFFTMFATGVRIGELSALMWTDIDFKKNLISIQRSVFFGGQKYGMKHVWEFKEPKTASGIRKVWMISPLRAALLLHQEKSELNKLGLVFATKFGNPYDRSTIGKILVKRLKDAKLKRIRPHDLRHSNASWLLSKGVDLAFVSKHLGHSTVSITSDIYHHFLPEDYQKVSGVLDESFCDNSVDNRQPQLPQNRIEWLEVKAGEVQL